MYYSKKEILKRIITCHAITQFMNKLYYLFLTRKLLIGNDGNFYPF